MKREDPKSIGDILADLQKTSELGVQLRLAEIWSRWPEVAGPHLAAHGRPRGIRDKVLHIEAESPVWMHRFAYRKWAILGRIHRILREELVSDLFIVLAEEPDDPPSQDGV